MALLEIVTYGNPVLRQKAKRVEEWTRELDKLVEDMLETMYMARGVGLAAPQVGISLQLFVVDISGGKNPDDIIIVRNPSILEVFGEERGDEGCLSIPGVFTPVTRPTRVILKGQTPSGEWKTWEGEGLLARAFCHETDHVFGKLYIDYLTPYHRERLLKRYKKMQTQKT